MDATTWIWFLPDPVSDKNASKQEKIEAIKKCLKESIPECKIQKTISYYRKERIGNLWPGSGLIVVTDRINHMIYALYEEILEGVYSLRNKGESESRYRSNSESFKKIELPSIVDISKYLSKYGGSKLDNMKDEHEIILNKLLFLLKREGPIDYSSAAEELGIPISSLSNYVNELVSKGEVIVGRALVPRIDQSLKIVALARDKTHYKISKKYIYVNWET